jgi:hypothetical protein
MIAVTARRARIWSIVGSRGCFARQDRGRAFRSRRSLRLAALRHRQVPGIASILRGGTKHPGPLA